MKKIILTLLCFIIIFASSQCLAVVDVKAAGYNYGHAFTTGETATFSFTVKNEGDEAVASCYLYVILTNSDTGVSIDPAATSAAPNPTINPGETRTFTGTWVSSAGKYTVQLRIYSAGDTLRLTTYAAFPIRVSGAPIEKLRIFPTILDLGVIPYGRHMHPVPLEITWDFFLYNLLREQKPWYMRIYTDNATRFKGIQNAVHVASPGGLVSSDGKYVIPLRVWCLNYPPEDQDMGWDTKLSGPPPVDDDTYWKGPLLDNGERFENKAAWLRIPDYSEMTSLRGTWRNLIGQDFYDTQYVTDVNPTGDFTLKSPFSVYFAAETDPTSVKGNYSANMILEIYSP